jgi:hypothetical protein
MVRAARPGSVMSTTTSPREEAVTIAIGEVRFVTDPEIIVHPSELMAKSWVLMLGRAATGRGFKSVVPECTEPAGT